MMKRLAMTWCLMACCSAWCAQGGDASDVPSGKVLDKAAVSDAELAGQRARGSGDTIDMSTINTQLSTANEKSRLDHNSVNGGTTGDNVVSNSAFAGASGFATVIQNSGNNVVIQNATIVNYAVHP